WLRVEILGASWGLSAWLRWSSWGPQLSQKGRQPPTNLCQGDNRAAMLPRTVHGFDQRTSQHQLVVHTRDHLRPPFRLFWGTQTWLIPEQNLLVQPEPMLMGVAQPIGRTDFGQGSCFIACPDKPTDLA